MISIGIDPGTNKLGLAFVSGNHCRAWSFHRPNGQRYLDRFKAIHQEVFQLVQSVAEHRPPDIVVIEQQVSMRGTARINETTFWICALAAANCRVMQVNPKVIKRYVTGSGSSPTPQVAKMASQRWKIQPEVRGKLDEDALMALAMAQLGLDVLRAERAGMNDLRLKPVY